MYNQSYENKYNNPGVNNGRNMPQRPNTAAKSSSSATLKRRGSPLSFVKTLGLAFLIFFLLSPVSSAIAYIDANLFPFAPKAAVSLNFFLCSCAVGLALTIFVYRSLMSCFNIDKKWWHAIMLGFPTFCVFTSISLSCSFMLNACDFFSPITSKYEYVCGRDQKGHTVYNKKTRVSHDVWNYYLTVKPDINSPESEVYKVEVSEEIFRHAEAGDDYYTYTRPGLFGYKHKCKFPTIAHNHIANAINKRIYKEDTEEYELNMKRMNLASRGQRLRKEVKANPKLKDIYEIEIKEIDKSIEEIRNRFKELETEYYRSLHEKSK